jgi:SAM-dependent methyltransferase
VNLGSGAHCPPGWICVDNSLGARLGRWPRVQRFLHRVVPEGARGKLLPSPDWPADCVSMDLTRPLLFEPSSVDFVYSSHVVEHLTRDEGRALLREIHRILRPGGVVRTLVPDLAAVVDAYVRDREERPGEASDRFHFNTWFFDRPVPRSWLELPTWYLRSRHNHRFLYDEPALRAALAEAGFGSIGRRAFGESDVPGILDVEVESRFESAFCLEAIK